MVVTESKDVTSVIVTERPTTQSPTEHKDNPTQETLTTDSIEIRPCPVITVTKTVTVTHNSPVPTPRK